MDENQGARGQSSVLLLQAEDAAISWTIDEAGRIVSVTHNVQHMTGFTAAEVTTRTSRAWIRQVHPEDITAVRAAYDALLSGNQLFDIEYRLRRRDKKYVEVRDRAIALFVKGGVRYAEGVITDIGDQLRTRRERTALFDIIRRMNAVAGLEELLQLTHQALKQVMFAENCFVALYNRATGLFEFPFFVDQYDAPPPPLRAEKTATGYVFRTRRPTRFTRTSYGEMVARGEAMVVGAGAACWMGVPLATPTELLGVLVVQNYDDQCAYDDRDLEFFASVGSQVALAIERKQAEQALRQARDKLELKVTERTAELADANTGLRREVAERKHIERALRESERFAHATLNSLTAHIAILDQTGTIIAVNEAWRKFAIANGMRAEQVSEGRNYLAVCDAAEGPDATGAAEFAAGIRAVLAGAQEKFSAEYSCDSPAESRWFVGIVTRFAGADDIRVVVAHENITERKQIEEALRQSERQYRILFEDNPHPMWVYDLKTLAFLAVNDAAIRHYGYSRVEFLGMTIRDIRPAEDIPALLEHVHRAPAGSSQPKVWRHRKKDQSIIAVEITTHTLRLPGERAKLVLALDVTERIQAEAELRTAQERIAGIISSAMDAIITVDAQQRVVLFNNAAELMFGYDAQEILGKPLDCIIPERFRRVHREHVPAFGLTHVTKRRMGALGAIFGMRSDGEEFPIEASISQVVAGGQRLYTVILRDITERRQAEAQIRQFNEELEQRVAQRTEQLEAANRELESFSYSVSHDLRAPLRAVAGFSRILREEYEPDLPPEAQQYLHRVQENAQQMGRLIDDLLAFSRLGRQSLNRQPVVPADLVRTVLAELQDELADRQVELVIGALPVCQGDHALLKQVFVNLLTNALKFTRQRKKARIEVGCLENAAEGAPVYYVKDNGVGFDMQYVHKLFGVFQRLHRAEEYEGTGVGLATVQRIILRHGGRIWAEANPGRGATFYFTLGKEIHD